ncbi:cell division protein ZipA [Vibrio sp. ZSDE26]|uniref:Cell division protein ZipA n=1 Tax=Vibrio amylolyticus TaxID=2847292 RepID=A0A9X1XHM8_9VIBR|nr:cell division protein ZipA [Vibrio amylolyticus]MCK6262215.1 cell division protein ZipA [Vibrio amylolyticus]
MQELRFVLIIVGALAIAALLFHGLWTSKKEGKAKFGDKPLGKLNTDNQEKDPTPERGFAPEDDFDIIRKERKTPSFQSEMKADPLIDSDPLADDYDPDLEPSIELDSKESEVIPSFHAMRETDENESLFSNQLDNDVTTPVAEMNGEENETKETIAATATAPNPEPEMQVIVLNVHCAGEVPFVGTKLFNSMEKNDLRYGEMDIFHYHVDSTSNSKVLFSVANMMQPGTLKHSDPAEFSTKGISFFMTLPCCGDAEQNFNLLLRTAQQIADDLGGNVLDDARNLMTPDRLSAYRRQIQEFKTALPA